jgi:steroid 5-alpha reductase family enzyme
MLKTILLLIVALVAVPLATIYFDTPLSEPHFLILRNCLFIYLGVGLGCFALAEFTGNCSQVDKIWSVVPIVYAWYIAVAGGLGDRAILMAILVTLWGARLTYNFSRRGAYSWKFWTGEEDYRWEVLRQMPMFQSRARWFFFNLFFISLYQNGLILLFTLPILVVLDGAEQPLFWADYLLGAVFVGLVVMETVADQQQWTYQNEKHRRKAAGESLTGIYKLGFTTTGLWKYMRHPNYTAEQAIWVCFYLFSVAATGRWFNWSVAGCVLLLLLFQGSSDFSEGISLKKYPAYAEYKRRVGRFLPKSLGRGMEEQLSKAAG